MRVWRWSWWLAIGFGASLTGSAWADIVQWRPAISAQVYRAGRFEAVVYQESWISSEGPALSYIQLSPRLRYHVLDHLTLGLNYSFIDSQVPERDGDTEWVDQNRVEFEVTPHREWSNGLKLQLRNRLEVRWIEHLPSENYRSRHLFEVAYPIHLPKPIQSVFSNGEFLYDWSRMRNSENRFSPLGFDLGIAKGVSLRVSYMWREVERPDSWAITHVFWTVLSLKRP